MIVKVGDSIYHSDQVPIMIILTQEDKKFISIMPEDGTKYCVYPDNMSRDEAKEWMKID